MRWRRISEMVSRSMPPELSAPSLNSTTAPMGRLDASASTCLRLSPMWVDWPDELSPIELGECGPAGRSICTAGPGNAFADFRAGRSSEHSTPLRDATRCLHRRRAMLEESSTTTATIFCCGRSVATLSAGCHSISSSSEASSGLHQPHCDAYRAAYPRHRPLAGAASSRTTPLRRRWPAISGPQRPSAQEHEGSARENRATDI